MEFCCCCLVFSYTWRPWFRKNVAFLREVKSWQSFDRPTGTNWLAWGIANWLLLSGWFPGNNSYSNDKQNPQSGESIRKHVRLNTQGTEGPLMSEGKSKFDVIYFSLCVCCVYVCACICNTMPHVLHVEVKRQLCESIFFLIMGIWGLELWSADLMNAHWVTSPFLTFFWEL